MSLRFERGSVVRRMVVLLLLASVPALASAWLHPRKPVWERAGEITVAEARSAGDILWIDARSESAWTAGRVPGALHLAPESWNAGIEAVLAAWSPGVRIVVYCDGGGCQTSHEVAERLRAELGMDNVHVLSGGWLAWQKATEGGGP